MAVARILPRLGPRPSCPWPTPSPRLLHTAAPGQGGRALHRGESSRETYADRSQGTKPHASRFAARHDAQDGRAQHRGAGQRDRPEDGRRFVKPHENGRRSVKPHENGRRSVKPHAHDNGHGGRKQQRGGVERYVIEVARKFVRPSGMLLTTRENVRFLLEHDIEPDNARMSPFTSQPQMRKIAAEYRVRLAISPRHVLNPFDLEYFDPTGHPLAAMMRSRYARRHREEPLWIMFSLRAGTSSAVVRGLTQRRLAGALHGALNRLGYNLAPGLGAHKEIRGTLWVKILDPVATAAHPPERFGNEIAAALDREHSRWL